PIDHTSGHTENTQSIDLSGLVQALDFDGDPITLAHDFTVKIVDDVPVLVSGASASVGAVDEGGLDGSSHGGDLYGSGNDHGLAVTATGPLSGLVSFGADGPDTGTVKTSGNNHAVVAEGFQLVSEHTAENWLASLNGGHGLTSHGQAIDNVDITVTNGVA